MANSKRIAIEIKNNNNRYTEIIPVTTKEQVIGWNIGDIFGPIDLTLKADKWGKNKQVIDYIGIEDTDILYCTKVLNGTKEQMQKQEMAYRKLSPINGIQSFRDKIQFTCNSIPEVDIKVQVWWTR